MAGNPVPFPDVRPSGRQFTPGEFPQKMFRAQNGASVAVRFGNRPFEAKLSLTFANISDEEARQIIKNYEDVNGEWDYVEFSNDSLMVAGVGDTLMSRYLRGTEGQDLKYRYAGPPEVNYVFLDRCSVRCELIGYVDGGLD